MRGILLALALWGCGHADDKQSRSPADPDVRALFDQTADRALALSEPRGWIVSRWEDGRVEHTGDSLLWTGMAMGALDCERGTVPEAALLAMLKETGGKVYRHPSEAARKPSLDGHLGFYWGIAQRVRRCPESAPLWVAAMATHEPVNVTGPFGHLLKAVKYQLGMSSAPKETTALTDTVAAWAYGVVVTKAAAYRIHLGLLSLEILENTGVGLPAAARSKFCAAARGSGMQTVEHFCGRGNLIGWVSTFEYNRYEYAHQRAKWEAEDGKLGLSTPGLDLLVALNQLYLF